MDTEQLTKAAGILEERLKNTMPDLKRTEDESSFRMEGTIAMKAMTEIVLRKMNRAALVSVSLHLSHMSEADLVILEEDIRRTVSGFSSTREPKSLVLRMIVSGADIDSDEGIDRYVMDIAGALERLETLGDRFLSDEDRERLEHDAKKQKENENIDPMTGIPVDRLRLLGAAANTEIRKEKLIEKQAARLRHKEKKMEQKDTERIDRLEKSVDAIAENMNALLGMLSQGMNAGNAGFRKKEETADEETQEADENIFQEPEETKEPEAPDGTEETEEPESEEASESDDEERDDEIEEEEADAEDLLDSMDSSLDRINALSADAQKPRTKGRRRRGRYDRSEKGRGIVYEESDGPAVMPAVISAESVSDGEAEKEERTEAVPEKDSAVSDAVSAEASVSETSVSSAELKALEAECDALREERDSLLKKVEELAASAERSGSLEEEAKRLAKSLNDARDQNADQREMIARLETERDNARKTVEEERERIEQLGDESVAERNRAKEAIAASERLRAEIEEMKPMTAQEIADSLIRRGMTAEIVRTEDGTETVEGYIEGVAFVVDVDSLMTTLICDAKTSGRTKKAIDRLNDESRVMSVMTTRRKVIVRNRNIEPHQALEDSLRTIEAL